MIVKKFDYAELSRASVDGQRLYTCPDGEAVPSVTTILDKTKSKEKQEGLARWRKSVGEEKAQQIVTEAANRGTRMHKYLEDYVNGEELKESVSNPYAQQSLDMAKVVVTLKIMPETPEVSLDPIKESSQQFIKEFGGGDDIRISEEPVAFCLKSINMIFVMDEDLGSTEDLENKIKESEGVSSVDVIDVRRAVG